MVVANTDQVGQLRRKLTDQIEQQFAPPSYSAKDRRQIAEYAVDGKPLSPELSSRMAGEATCLGFFAIMEMAEELDQLQKEETLPV